MTHPYWNDIWPGYDKPRGLPCCKTNERGYRCSCAEPAPIPEGQLKRDPYQGQVASRKSQGREEQASTGGTLTFPNASYGRTSTVDFEYDDAGRPKFSDAGLGFYGGLEEAFDDELGVAPGLYKPRPTLARKHRAAATQKREVLCAFEHNGCFFMAQPQKLFKPLGLMIWGAPEGATMEAAYVGNCTQLLVSMSKFPAAWFAQSQSFEQIFERAKEGLVPASFGSWDTCEVGVMLRVMIESKTGAQLGPKDGVQIGMWGYSVFAVTYNPFRPDDAPDIQDEDRKRWNAQQSADPRTKHPKHRARLALYEDSYVTTAERGTRLHRFLEPEGK